jgi:hypothetical protein
MSKNAYEIRLDVLAIAHQYETGLFTEKVRALEDSGALKPAEVEKLYPSKETILRTADMFYSFVCDNSRK